MAGLGGRRGEGGEAVLSIGAGSGLGMSNGSTNGFANGGGGTSSSSGSGAGSSANNAFLAFVEKNVQRVNLPGNDMYAVVLPANNAGSGSNRALTNGSNGAVRAGKQRVLDGDSANGMDVDGHEGASRRAVAMQSAPVGREDFVRVVLQALRDVGYSQAAHVLEAESGYIQEPPVAQSFAQAILGGRWAEAIALLRELGVITAADTAGLRLAGHLGGGRRSLPDIAEVAGTYTPAGEADGEAKMLSRSVPLSSFGGESALSTSPANGEASNGLHDRPSVADLSDDAAGSDETSAHGIEAIFMILQQKYLELLEVGQTKRALTVLRGELAPLVKSASKRRARTSGDSMTSERLHALSGFMMLLDRNDLYTRAKWDGAAGTSRHTLLAALQNFISPGVMIPPRRLHTLFAQAARYQRSQCKWHTGTIEQSLLWDHRCPREQFPTITTHVLAEHLDEVWDIKWSHNGRYLASASVDMTAIVWKVGHEPGQSCSKQATLKNHREPVSAIAWNRDDTRLLTASESTVYIWDPMDGTLFHSSPSHHLDTITAIAYMPDGSFVTSAMDMRMVFWTEGGLVKTSWNTMPLRVNDFVVTPDGKRIIAIAISNDTRPDAKGGVKPAASRAPEAAAAAGSTDTAESKYPMAKMERHIVIYNVETGKIQARRALPSELTSITLAADQEHVLVNAVPDELQLWNIENDILRLVRKYTGHLQREYQLKSCFGGPDRSFVLSGGEDGHVYAWHKDTGALLEVLEGHDRPVNSVAWNPSNPSMFASCSDDRTVRIWQPPYVAEAMAAERAANTNGNGATSNGDSGSSAPVAWSSIVLQTARQSSRSQAAEVEAAEEDDEDEDHMDMVF